MKLKLLKSLLLLLVVSTSIAYSQPATGKKPPKSIILGDSMTAVSNYQLDILIVGHATAGKLKIDTALKGIKIRTQAAIISDQDERTKILNIEAGHLETINTAYKTDNIKLSDKLTKAEKKAGRRGKTIWCLIGAALIELVVILIK